MCEKMRNNKDHRNRKGQFEPGHKYGIQSSERARELQKLAVQSRLRNQRQKMLKALRLVYAEQNEWDILEKMYLGIAEQAFSGNIKAVQLISKILRGGQQ